MDHRSSEWRESTDRIRRKTVKAKQHYSRSAVETVWNRLSALDFINQAMVSAAILLLCFLPLLIVVSALAGRDVVNGLSRDIGLNHQASQLVQQLFNPSPQISGAVTARGMVFTVLGGVGTAATLQAIYERLYGLGSQGMKGLTRQLLWIAAVLVASLFVGWLGRSVGVVVGGPVLFGVISFMFVVAFWYFTMWLLVGSRVTWRSFVPPAVATSVCWPGLGVFSKFFFSGTVIGDHHEYGPIGAVFALMSWLIAIGVVIILGAVVGIVWLERDLSLAGAIRRVTLPRRRRRNTAS